MSQPTANTFWVYKDQRGVHNVVDSLEKVPPSLKDKATAVTLSPEEAQILRQPEPPSEATEATPGQMLDNGSEYAGKLPPGITPDTMAAAGIFLLALVFLRRLAKHYGYKTFARVASIAIFTMAIGVVWTFAGVVIKENAAEKEAAQQQEETTEQAPQHP